jgi:pyrimidine operon attenuation protein / uracil phosphoribosyltransferase
MKKRLILPESQFDIALSRLCQELIENFGNFSNTVLIGLQPRGVALAKILNKKLEKLGCKDIPLGLLDTTFHRDDFRRKEEPIKASQTQIPFLIEDKKVVLIDDVLFTGRSVRAALDAMIAYGRARSVHLLVLISRKNNQELPITATFIGKQVNTMASERVEVEWSGKDQNIGKVWLVNSKASDG